MSDLTEFPAIIDLSGYNQKMRKSFLEKTFFLTKIPATVYLDYGCADGSMIEFMTKLFPEFHYFGYDNDPKMIEMAKNLKVPNAVFSANFDELVTAMKKIDGIRAVICSSLIHEVYAYQVGGSVVQFWNRINNNFNYVCIRDMAMTREAEGYDVSSHDIWALANYYLKEKDDVYILNDFQKKYGEITKLKQMTHFLLKYRYKNNWERELNENYFPLPVEELLKQFATVEYKNHYLLPFLKEKVKQDFGIELKEPTHIQLIAKLR
jgi:16S rRNA C1402 N4-methylase RsmH